MIFSTPYTHDELNQIKNAISIFPPLTNDSFKKGDYGRIGVIGGSTEYTGAPYFASFTPLQIGADLSYVFSPENAAPVIKSYSPELIVYPTINFDDMEKTLKRVHSLVFGPGCGRDTEKLVPLFRKVLNFIDANLNVSLVVDADGLFIAGECIKELRDCNGQVILTPNSREFERIYKKVFPNKELKENDDNSEQVKELAAELKLCVVQKQFIDVISDGKTVNKCQIKGTPRRCGGQGDILTGTIALFIHWARLKADPENNIYSSQHLIQGALAGCEFVRFTSRKTFERIGRSMKANDVIGEIPEVVRQIDRQFGDKKFDG